MDVITETSLTALIQRATDPRNQNPDVAAIEAVCGILNKEPEGAHIAAKLIASKIQSSQEWEALQSLSILEACMKHCGAPFHSEIGKFRFLNEMIKLVSPKYLGAKTPPVVRKQVLQLMHSWTLDYPKETKIREAYEMLKKQGVVAKEDTSVGVISDKAQSAPSSQRTNALFQDEEKSKLLQKLLQSKNPDDLQAANKLIKTMVKEDERRTELKSRRATELETVHNNVRLLNEMLDSYKPGQASSEDLELIKELHQGCERLRTNVFRLAAESQDNEEMLNQVLAASDELGQVFDKYNAIIILRKPFEPSGKIEENSNNQSSLLDLSTPSEESTSSVPASSDILTGSLASLGLDLKLSQPVTTSNTIQSHKVDLDTLGEIFGSINTQSNPIVQPVALTPRTPVLQPTQSTVSKVPSQQKSGSQEKNSKTKAFEELDVLGKSLMNQCKMDASLAAKSSEKVTLNLLTKQSSQLELLKEDDNKTESSSVGGGDIELLIGGGVEERERKESKSSTKSVILNGDDLMVDLSDECIVSVDKDIVKEEKCNESPEIKSKAVNKCEIKPMTDLFVSLESIKPSSVPPLNVIDEKNGLSVTLHFAKDTPREDVSVIVVTTISKNSTPLSNYLFQAVIPKSCKMKLQPPSGSDLPAHNPFLPPSAITQIMLIANPQKEPVSLKVMISYTMEDETITEMGEVERLPLNM